MVPTPYTPLGAAGQILSNFVNSYHFKDVIVVAFWIADSREHSFEVKRSINM